MTNKKYTIWRFGMIISDRMQNMQSSPIRKLIPYAQAAEKKGITVFRLNIGQPDIATPKAFLEAIRNYDNDVIAYAHSQGIPPMLESLVRYYKKFDIPLETEDLIVTTGGSEALIFAMMTIANPGDEVIIPEPFYANYNSFATLAGLTVKPVTLKAETGFHFPSVEEIEEKITDKTRAFIIANPSNPTGTVYTKEEVDMITDLAIKHDIMIIADEVYREFVYDGEKYVSFMHRDDALQNVILVDSISKRFSNCGARIGAIGSKNKDVMTNVMKLAQARLSVATLEQVGAAAIVDAPDYDEFMQEAYDEYKLRRDTVYNGLKNIKGVVAEQPKGAFYNVAKLPVDDAEKFIIWLLENFNIDNETILMAPAEGFYATPGLGKNEVRFSYCIKSEELERSMKILEKALEAYPGRTEVE